MKLDTTNAVIYNNYAYFLSLRNERPRTRRSR